MKDLLITHIDTDGISPIILMYLTKRKFEYKSIEIGELSETFEDLLKQDLDQYETIYITDLTIPENIYEALIEKHKNILVFDHHETHLFATKYPFVTISVTLNNKQTCATELFYNYLKEKYPIINTPHIKDYVEQVRQIDTFTFTSDLPKKIAQVQEIYGNLEFIKNMVKRLKKDKDAFTLTPFEKRFVRLKAAEEMRFLQRKEGKMKIYEIKNRRCGVVFSESNKNILGNYLSEKHSELDLIILFNASGSISYRTTKDDVSVAEFASLFGGGGHQKASGSPLTDEDRFEILKYYFKEIKEIEK